MTTFRDNQRQINIPILSIYFMLSEEERAINGTTYSSGDDVGILGDTSVSQLQVGGGMVLADLTEVLGCLGRHGIPASEQRMVAGELARIV